MTQKRSWLALGALMAALVGGALWAAEQQKKTAPAPAPACCAEGKACCTAGAACCAEKPSVAEKTKSCCGDGKCCGCCEKRQKTAVLPVPVPPGSSVQVLIESAGSGGYGYRNVEWAAPATAVPPATVPQPVLPPSVNLPQLSTYYSVPAMAQPPQSPPAPSAPMCYSPCPAGGVCVSTPGWQEVASQGMCPPPPAPAPSWVPWRLHSVTDKEHTCLEMQMSGGGEDARACCESMVLKVGKESLKVSVADKQVHVCGSFFKGTADSVVRNSADGSVVLEGHVDLKYERKGQKATVSAERVVVGLADGRLEVKPVEQPQILTFWLGFAH